MRDPASIADDRWPPDTIHPQRRSSAAHVDHRHWSYRRDVAQLVIATAIGRSARPKRCRHLTVRGATRILTGAERSRRTPDTSSASTRPTRSRDRGGDRVRSWNAGPVTRYPGGGRAATHKPVPDQGCGHLLGVGHPQRGPQTAASQADISTTVAAPVRSLIWPSRLDRRFMSAPRGDRSLRCCSTVLATPSCPPGRIPGLSTGARAFASRSAMGTALRPRRTSSCLRRTISACTGRLWWRTDIDG